MQNDELQTQLRRLIYQVLNGKMSRREAIRKAGMLGIAAPVAASLIRTGLATAQDAPEVGHTIAMPEGLRTDLAGQTVRAVLSSDTGTDVPWLNAFAGKFTEATGINVELIPGEQNTGDRLAIYNQQFGAQSSDIDVVQIDVIHPGILAQHFIDLSEPLADLAALHFPALIENNTVDGALVAMPWFTDAGLLFYRQDLLDKYSFEVPVTWDELEEAAAAIQEGERAEHPDFAGFAFQGNAYEGLTCNGLEWQVSHGGGRIVEDVDGTATVTVNNEAAIASFERAAGWVGGIAPAGVTTYQEPETFNSFVGGNVAFIRNWPYVWANSQLEDSVIRGLIGVTSVPMGTGEGARHAATLGGWQLSVSRYSQAQEASIEFIKALASPEALTSRAIENSQLPTIASVYDDPGVAEASEFIPRLKDIFQGGAVARPSSITSYLYNDVSIAYYTALNQVLTGQVDAASAAADIEEQLNDILSEL